MKCFILLFALFFQVSAYAAEPAPMQFALGFGIETCKVHKSSGKLAYCIWPEIPNKATHTFKFEHALGETYWAPASLTAEFEGKAYLESIQLVYDGELKTYTFHMIASPKEEIEGEDPTGTFVDAHIVHRVTVKEGNSFPDTELASKFFKYKEDSGYVYWARLSASVKQK